MDKKHTDKDQWTEPEVTDFEITDLTRSSSGTDFDGIDPEPSGS